MDWFLHSMNGTFWLIGVLWILNWRYHHSPSQKNTLSHWLAFTEKCQSRKGLISSLYLSTYLETYSIGNPTDKRVWYFLNHWYQRVGRCVLISVVALPSLVMIQQNTPSNSLISVIQKKSHSFIRGISNNIISILVKS